MGVRRGTVSCQCLIRVYTSLLAFLFFHSNIGQSPSDFYEYVAFLIVEIVYSFEFFEKLLISIDVLMSTSEIWLFVSFLSVLPASLVPNLD